MENFVPETTTVTAGRSRAELFVEPFNGRVTVNEVDVEVAEEDLPQLAAAVLELAQEARLGKIVWRARPSEWLALLGQGFVLEAVVPCFLKGKKCFFMARFTREERRMTDRFVKEDRIVDEVRSRAGDDDDEAAPELPDGYEIASWRRVDAADLRQFYEGIFATYPTPLTAPGFIERALAERRVIGRVALYEGRIASSAAIDLERRQGHAEVTDCGTAPEHRGKGLNRFLISDLEPEAWAQDARCLFAIARARSYGMNRVLYRSAYGFGGRLVKHSHIAGQLEDMNVWYKCDG